MDFDGIQGIMLLCAYQRNFKNAKVFEINLRNKKSSIFCIVELFLWQQYIVNFVMYLFNIEQKSISVYVQIIQIS